MASAIEDLTSAEEQIIEAEVADVAKLNNVVDLMIENTLTSILNKNDNQDRNNETRVSPMPPAFTGASNTNSNFDDEGNEMTSWNDLSYFKLSGHIEYGTNTTSSPRYSCAFV